MCRSVFCRVVLAAVLLAHTSCTTASAQPPSDHWDARFKEKHTTEGLVAMYTFEQSACFTNAPHLNVADNALFPSMILNPSVATCDNGGERPGITLRNRTHFAALPTNVQSYGAINTVPIHPKVASALNHPLGFSFEFWFSRGQTYDDFYDTQLLGIDGSPFDIRTFRYPNKGQFLQVTTPTGQQVQFNLVSDLGFDGNLVHIVLTFSAGSNGIVRAYVNNGPPKPSEPARQIQRAAVSFKFLLQGGHALTVLQRPSDEQRFFQPKLHLVSIYNRVLTPQQVAQNYEAKFPGAAEEGVLSILPPVTVAVVQGESTTLRMGDLFPSLAASASLVLMSLPDAAVGTLWTAGVPLDSTSLQKTGVFKLESELLFKVNKKLDLLTFVETFDAPSFKVAVFESAKCGGKTQFNNACIVPGAGVQLRPVIRNQAVSYVRGTALDITLDAAEGCIAFDNLGASGLARGPCSSNAKPLTKTDLLVANEGVALCVNATSSSPVNQVVEMYYKSACSDGADSTMLAKINLNVVEPIEVCAGTDKCVALVDTCFEDNRFYTCFVITALDRRPASQRIGSLYNAMFEYTVNGNATSIKFEKPPTRLETPEGLLLTFEGRIDLDDNASGELVIRVGPNGEVVDLNGKSANIASKAAKVQIYVLHPTIPDAMLLWSKDKPVVLAEPFTEVPQFYQKEIRKTREDEYQVVSWPGAGNSPFSHEIEWINDDLPEFDFTAFVLTIFCAGYRVVATTPESMVGLVQIDPCFGNVDEQACIEGRVIGSTKALLGFLRDNVHLTPVDKESEPAECRLSLSSEQNVILADTVGREIYIAPSDGTVLFMTATAAGSISVAAGAITLMMWYSTLWVLSSRARQNKQLMLASRRRGGQGDEGGEDGSFVVDAPEREE